MSRSLARRMVERGFVELRGAVPRERLDQALRIVNHRLGARRGPVAAESQGYWEEELSGRPLEELTLSPPLWAAAESLLGGGLIEPPRHGRVAVCFPEEEGSRREPAIHVDKVRLGDKPGLPPIILDIEMVVGVLLSDLPRPFMGNLTVFPGSHRRIAALAARKGLRVLAALPGAIQGAESLQVSGRAGDAVLYHPLLAHDRSPNRSPFIRYMVFFHLRRKPHALR